MKKSSSKILSSLIVKFSDVQAENFYFQVKFINCFLRETISFTKKIDIIDRGQSRGMVTCIFIQICILMWSVQGVIEMLVPGWVLSDSIFLPMITLI